MTRHERARDDGLLRAERRLLSAALIVCAGKIGRLHSEGGALSRAGIRLFATMVRR